MLIPMPLFFFRVESALEQANGPVSLKSCLSVNDKIPIYLILALSVWHIAKDMA